MAQYWVSHSRNHGVNTHISTGEMQARPDGFTDNGGFHVHSGHCHLESGLMNIQKECTCHLALYLVRSSGGSSSSSGRQLVAKKLTGTTDVEASDTIDDIKKHDTANSNLLVVTLVLLLLMVAGDSSGFVVAVAARSTAVTSLRMWGFVLTCCTSFPWQHWRRRQSRRRCRLARVLRARRRTAAQATQEIVAGEKNGRRRPHHTRTPSKVQECLVFFSSPGSPIVSAWVVSLLMEGAGTQPWRVVLNGLAGGLC
mmetsp:Transcript_47047/g.93658  ORF Transcript_47047/g.93658 Transcript_47047/m.93658 type:complete len:254 (-) Transcript_47047:351-1112(-)